MPVARHTAIRASDADRDAVADRLRAATVEGRLDAGELEQRLHVARCGSWRAAAPAAACRRRAAVVGECGRASNYSWT
jgi:hypothetical protein